nr:MAG TPA_asm: hypothetical protein [Caudoviricetes sp.]
MLTFLFHIVLPMFLIILLDFNMSMFISRY